VLGSAGRSTVPGIDLKVIGTTLVGNMTGFSIGVAGVRLAFALHGGHDPVIVEDLGANTYLAFSGSAAVTLGTAGTSSITAALDGWIEHVVLRSPLGVPGTSRWARRTRRRPASHQTIASG
jgi:hypothetical protein